MKSIKTIALISVLTVATTSAFAANYCPQQLKCNAAGDCSSASTTDWNIAPSSKLKNQTFNFAIAYSLKNNNAAYVLCQYTNKNPSSSNTPFVVAASKSANITGDMKSDGWKKTTRSIPGYNGLVFGLCGGFDSTNCPLAPATN